MRNYPPDRDPAFETALEAIHGDVDDYFVKPADIDSLVSALQRRLLDRIQSPS